MKIHIETTLLDDLFENLYSYRDIQKGAEDTYDDIDSQNWVIKEYKRCRDTLMNIPQIKEALPAFIKSNRTSSDFRRYMQGAKAHYAERRTMISEF